MKVVVVAEFYPRAADPALGVWAHRQALAARDAGADVRVVVLHRPLPPAAQSRSPAAWRSALAQPRHGVLDGIEIDYLRYLSPPRARAYGSWGAWAAGPLALHLRRLRRTFPFDLVHAHNAVPAADAVLRARIGKPLVVSVHGGDVLFTAPRYPAGRAAVARAYGAARLVLANSTGIERAARDLGAANARVLRLGSDVPPKTGRHAPCTLVTVGNLIARKRHADVLRAMWLLGDRWPDLRYVVIGDGPERGTLERLAGELGIAERVQFTGRLPHDEALRTAREGTIFVMPSTDEAFGVAYIEAMAAGLPAIGALGEPGPEEIAAAGDGLRMVPPGDVEALAAEIGAMLDDASGMHALGDAARATVARHFTWEECGKATVRAYEDAL